MNSRLGLFLIAALLSFSAACSTARHSGNNTVPNQPANGEARAPEVTPGPGPSPSPEIMGPPEPFGPPTPPPAEKFGPEPEKARGVVLVLGPGMARAFAAVGVLRALAEAKVPVTAILGSEMGSLMAALYASNPNINRFEWLLMRFNGETLSARRSFLTRVFERANDLPLDRELERAFGAKEIQETPIPLRIAIEFKNSGLPVLADHGRIAQAVRAALAVPGFLDEGTWEGVPAVAAEGSKPFPVEEAQALRLGPVVVLNVAEKVPPAQAAALEKASLVLTPNLTGIQAGDYEKSTETAYRGKIDAAARIAEIRQLVEKYN